MSHLLISRFHTKDFYKDMMQKYFEYTIQKITKIISKKKKFAGVEKNKNITKIISKKKKISGRRKK